MHFLLELLVRIPRGHRIFKKGSEMPELPSLYNSKITKIYLEYLQKAHPTVDQDDILAYSAMKRYEVEDPAHWFNQEQVDRFHEIIVRLTGNDSISRDAGRYATAAAGTGALKQYALGFLSPSYIYPLLGKMHSMMSRGQVVVAKKIGPNKVEIISTPKPGVDEKIYQCENRIGVFESVTKLFWDKLAEIEHPECFHKNGKRCRYIITWESSPTLIWKRIRNITLSLGVAAIIIGLILLPTRMWPISILSAIIVSVGVAYLSGRIENRELVKTIQSQGDAAKGHLDEINMRYNNALLVQEIGQVTSMILDENELVESVAEVMKNRLDFDRGIILLVDHERKHLIYASGYGYKYEEEAALAETEFNLDNPNSTGPFVLAFRERKPFLLNDVGQNGKTLSERSLKLAKAMGVKSLVCVPIVYEKESLGVLAVDNVRSARPLTQSDVSLLSGVSSHVAMGIINARSFQRLSESEKKYRDLVENASSIIMRIDIKGDITFFNEYAQRFFEYGEADVIGKSVIGTILPRTQEDTRVFEGLLRDLLKVPERPVVTETENVLRTGQRVWITWTYKPISENGKDFEEVLCIGNNITELKQAQEERRELEARLQRSQKMEALGTLAGGVAHDLNNILSGLVGYPELLLMDLPGDSRLRKPLLTIQKSGEKAAQIVQDLLTLARRGVAVSEVVNLNRIVTDYLQSPEFMRLMEFHSAVKLATELAPDLMNVIGSPVHLSKTIMNLVSNAAEAMPGGGAITVRTENHYVEKFIHGYDSIERGDYVVVTVSDTGIGIAPADRERIFEPFYSKKVMGRSGTGLGMAVVWGTVKDHKGYIDLQSEEGKGTTFTLYFPVTRQEMADKTRPVTMEDLKGDGQTIVVVDDVNDQREIATEMLQRLGYKVAAMKSGEDAVEYLRENRADLLVLDMIMDPGIDGLETYRRILEIHPRQKAIITSGFSESERVMEARRLGVGDYVKKPYLIEKLGLAVKQALKR
jgi:PAS domain S-box-containing protein